MVTCPVGHESTTTDYCDECGRPSAPPAPPAASGSHDMEPVPSSATQVRRVEQPGEPCPLCQEPRRGTDRYCEHDGYDFEAAAPLAVGWAATVHTDRARFDALHPDELEFPTDAPTFTCGLDADSVTVGRRSPSRGIEPDIDLGGRYDDPGVSRRHLRFDRADDGSYTVVDCGSANGTTLNDDPSPLTPDVPRPLAHGDRVHLGAWTTITIERQPTGTSSP
jgi:hypothetical protein